MAARLQVLQDELAMLGLDLRAIGEDAVDDPERRDHVRQRRQLLVELRRKYGPTIDDVMRYHPRSPAVCISSSHMSNRWSNSPSDG